MPMTCPNCGNARNFLVKTLQLHVVHLEDARVDVTEESRPAVFEVLCDQFDLSKLRFMSPFPDTHIDFIGKRKICYIMSAIFILASTLTREIKGTVVAGGSERASCKVPSIR